MIDNLGQQGLNAAAIIDSPNIVCECGCKTFAPAAVLKKVSSLITMTGKDEIVDIPVYVCTKCGKVPQEYLDKQNAARIFGEKKETKNTKDESENKSNNTLII